MIALGASQQLYAVATNATTVNYTITGLLMTNANPPVATGYQQLAQGQCASSAGSIYNPGISATALLGNINLFNTGTTTQTVSLYISGSATTNQIATLQIPAGGFAEYTTPDGWSIYSAAGLQVTGTSLVVGQLGTPASSTTALTASTQIVQGGTLFQLATNQLAVGSTFRWTINILKTTGAGTATWTAKVCFGTAGTNADTAIATFTSGTNTGAIDRATLIILARITALGSGTSATAACTALYVNSLTTVTGLGDQGSVPGATAGFDSTVTTPYMHVDITMGASAVCTAVGAAECLHA